MIELATERISPETESKLRAWLKHPECGTLSEVARDRCRLLQSSALDRALQAKPGEPADLLSQDDMRQAARYATFRDILAELVEQPKSEPFLTVKLLNQKAHATIRHDPED